MQLPVTLKPRPSRVLGAALILVHALAALGLAATDLALVVKLLSGFGLLLSLVYDLRRHVLQPTMAALTLRADGQLEIQCGDGPSTLIEIHPQTTVFPWLVVLLTKGQTRAIPLLPDSLAGRDFRQLRLWLRWLARTD